MTSRGWGLGPLAASPRAWDRPALALHRGVTFGDVEAGELLLYEDAHRRPAIAVNRGSAAQRLGIGVGDRAPDRPIGAMSESAIGFPRLHLRRVDSTNARARELAAAGAPHGMVVTASFQEQGRGRQGRGWVAPPGRGLLCSLVVREPSRLLSLAAGVAVAETVQAMRRPDPVSKIWQHIRERRRPGGADQVAQRRLSCAGARSRGSSSRVARRSAGR